LKDKLLGSSSSEQDLQEIESSLQEKKSELRQVRGQEQLKDLKEQRRQELKQKKQELKKKEFQQTKAGQLLGSVGNALDSLSNDIDGSSQEEKQAKQGLMQLSDNLEAVDGDGKNDNKKAVNLLGTQEPVNKDEVLGTVEVEGELEIDNNDSSKKSGKSSDDLMAVDMGWE